MLAAIVSCLVVAVIFMAVRIYTRAVIVRSVRWNDCGFLTFASFMLQLMGRQT